MNLIEYADRDMMMIDLAQILAGSLNATLMHEDAATLVVPGGNTPGPIFDYISAADLDWSRVHVMLSDERWLPDTNPRSNTRLLKQRLLVGHAAAASLITLYADAPEPEDRLPDLIAQVTPHLPITTLLLGMGADMHTASLFPGADRLGAALANDAPPLMAMRAPVAAEPRITLTAPVLAAALDKHIVIIGDDKRAAYERARSTHDAHLAPVTAVWNGATVHWAA